MSEDDYRPKSPDLNFGSYSPSPHHSQSQPQQHQQQPPQTAPLRVDPPQNWYQSPQGHEDYSHSGHSGHSRSYSYSASATAQSPTGPGFYSYQPLSATTPSYNSPRFPPHQYPNPQQHQQQAYTGQEQQPYIPPVVSKHASGYQQASYQLPYSQQGYTQPSPGYDQPYLKPEDPYDQQPQLKPEDNPDIQVKAEEPEGSNMPPRRAAAAAAAAADTPAVEPSPVKTKFPTARIKRIMQADEEVGKVAQQTPIAVGKALELFMIQLVSKSAEVARDKNSKRVTPAMLKTVVEADDQWDFLRDIVSKVEQDKEGGGSKGKAVAKAESDSEEESDVPKKKRGGGRKKKAA